MPLPYMSEAWLGQQRAEGPASQLACWTSLTGHIQASLQLENIVRVTENFVHQGRVVLVIEFVEG